MFFHLSCACRTLQVPGSAWFPKQFHWKGIPLCSICLPLVLHLPAISVLWLHWDRRISFVLTGLPLHLSTTSLLVCSEIAAKQFPLPPTCLCAVLGTEEFHLPTPCRSLVPHFSQLLSLFPACLSNAVALCLNSSFFAPITYGQWFSWPATIGPWYFLFLFGIWYNFILIFLRHILGLP